VRGHKCLLLAPMNHLSQCIFDRQDVHTCPEFCWPSSKGFSPGLSFSFLVAQRPSPPRCAECELLWKDYGDASLKRVRAYGNLKLANLRSDSETMEMLAEAATVADQKLEEVKRKIREHDSIRHAFQKPTHQTS